MSIVANQLQQTFYSPNRQQLQQQRAKLLSHCNQQLNGKQPIESRIKSQEKYETNKDIKYKLLLRQRNVAATAADTRPSIQKNKSRSQDVEEITGKAWQDSYLRQQDSGETKDYQIYQNGKVNKFFQNGKLASPQRVADICLVNDHYILVKTPNQKTKPAILNHNSLDEVIVSRKEVGSLNEISDKILKENEMEKKKLCRYLRSKRNRITKIAPIHEEPEELSNDEDTKKSKLYCLKVNSCWKANRQEVETYQTRTKIVRNMSNSACERHNINPQSSPTTMTTDTRNPRDTIKTISGSLSKSSPQREVSLHKYGSLIDSQNNCNNNNSVEIIDNPRRRKCPHLSNFLWLLRPFRGKYRQTKPKIQAVVYKTYFVKWTKPPDTLTSGYGVKALRPLNVEMSVLRRCRSALF